MKKNLLAVLLLLAAAPAARADGASAFDFIYVAGAGAFLAVIAGIFLSLATITGGMWLVRRSRHRPALLLGKQTLLFLGGMPLLGVVAAVGFSSSPNGRVAAGVLLAGGLIAAAVVGALAVYFIRHVREDPQAISAPDSQGGKPRSRGAGPRMALYGVGVAWIVALTGFVITIANPEAGAWLDGPTNVIAVPCLIIVVVAPLVLFGALLGRIAGRREARHEPNLEQ
jgi:hypothetical protein